MGLINSHALQPCNCGRVQPPIEAIQMLFSSSLRYFSNKSTQDPIKLPYE